MAGTGDVAAARRSGADGRRRRLGGNPIDRFVLASLESTASRGGEADRTLIKQVAYDVLTLTDSGGGRILRGGLAADAYEHVVDGYLRSPQHG